MTEASYQKNNLFILWSIYDEINFNLKYLKLIQLNNSKVIRENMLFGSKDLYLFKFLEYFSEELDVKR